MGPRRTLGLPVSPSHSDITFLKPLHSEQVEENETSPDESVITREEPCTVSSAPSSSSASSSSSSSSERDEQTRICKKDQGYAWVILFASSVIPILSLGLAYSVGVFYVELQRVFNKGPSDVGLLGALHTGTSFAFGPVAAEMVVRFDHRKIAIAGALLAASSITLTSLASSLWVINITYGILAGIGFNMAYISAVTIIPQYFEKHRAAAFALPSAGIGLGTVIIPPLLKCFLNSYGWRGTLLLTGGVALQMTACACLLVPNEPKAPLQRIVSMKSHSRTATDTWKSILFLFRHYRFILLLINTFVFNMGCVTVFVMIVDYAERRGVPSEMAVGLLSTVGVTSTVGRLLVTGTGISVCSCNRQMLYIGSCGISGIVAGLLPFAETFVTMAVLAALYGLFFGYQSGLIATVTAECVSEGKVDLPFGICMFVCGVGSACGTITAGWIYEFTGSYDLAFLVAGAETVVAALVMLPNLASPKEPLSAPEEVCDDFKSGESLQRFTASLQSFGPVSKSHRSLILFTRPGSPI